MGKRASFLLSDIVQNPNVSVSIEHRTQGSGDGSFQLLIAEVTLRIPGTYDEVFQFDLDVSGGMIELCCDLNSWTLGFEKRYRFLSNLGCEFSVC